MIHDHLEHLGLWETFYLVYICFPLVTPFIFGTFNPLFWTEVVQEVRTHTICTYLCIFYCTSLLNFSPGL
jgi:hypothetical protein